MIDACAIQTNDKRQLGKLNLLHIVPGLLATAAFLLFKSLSDSMEFLPLRDIHLGISLNIFANSIVNLISLLNVRAILIIK